ncbi:unnamed protein product [Ilex paraguariensis]|uniref:Uncharacterized protein n=1 Tax=Ilex paraguariensis TaxID=185542 RepID=A0ABC8T296_9AQUA
MCSAECYMHLLCLVACVNKVNSILIASVDEIAMMEEELKTNTELIKKQERLIQGLKKELKDRLEKHNTELEKVE